MSDLPIDILDRVLEVHARKHGAEFVTDYGWVFAGRAVIILQAAAEPYAVCSLTDGRCKARFLSPADACWYADRLAAGATSRRHDAFEPAPLFAKRTKPRVTRSDLLTPGEAAKLLDVGTTTVQQWAAQGKLRVRWTLGGQRRYYAHEVAALVVQRRVREHQGRRR